MVAESPPLPTSTSPLATACMRCTKLGNEMISASMPSGARYFGIRNAALVVVVKAVPIFTLRIVCPSEERGTIAAAATVVARNLRRVIIVFAPAAEVRNSSNFYAAGSLRRARQPSQPEIHLLQFGIPDLLRAALHDKPSGPQHVDAVGDLEGFG